MQTQLEKQRLTQEYSVSWYLNQDKKGIRRSKLLLNEEFIQLDEHSRMKLA